MTAARVTPGAISLSSSSDFPLSVYSYDINPVALPPGRARLSTKPPLTGSPMFENTIGTVRVACSNGPTAEVPEARMTSGASATNSTACLRISARLVVAQRVSICTLRPMVQPNSASACTNALNGAWNPASSAAAGRRMPMRLACCARAASGHAAAAPPSSVMNSRRLIAAITRSPRQRGRAAYLARLGRAPLQSWC
jgi:hypothetical protein